VKLHVSESDRHQTTDDASKRIPKVIPERSGHADQPKT
jgi:hypothetical protein